MSFTTRVRPRVPPTFPLDTTAVLSWFCLRANRREPLPWLGAVGIALAVSAVFVTGVDFALPFLALCAWWWCIREPAAWLLPLGAGLLGAAWITVGVGLIGLLPLSTAGLIWASIAAFAAVAGALARALTGRKST
jgi:hypothetical protein